MSFGTFLVFAILVLVLYFLIKKFFSRYKSLHYGSVTFITGGIKSGKTGLGVYLSIKERNKRQRLTKFRNFFRRLFNKPLIEMPLLYSNMPLDTPYVQMTEELLTRQKRFRFKSSVLLDEVSMTVDGMEWRDENLNKALTDYNKLFGHETHGGAMFITTHSLKDLHFSFERVCSKFYYIDHITWFIPFFAVVHLVEVSFSVDGSLQFNQTKDMSDILKKVIVPKWYFKKYDPYCYSAMTDDLPVEDTVIRPRSLKLKQPLTFRGAVKNLLKKEKEVKKIEQNN